MHLQHEGRRLRSFNRTGCFLVGATALSHPSWLIQRWASKPENPLGIGSSPPRKDDAVLNHESAAAAYDSGRFAPALSSRSAQIAATLSCNVLTRSTSQASSSEVIS